MLGAGSFLDKIAHTKHAVLKVVLDMNNFNYVFADKLPTRLKGKYGIINTLLRANVTQPAYNFLETEIQESGSNQCLGFIKCKKPCILKIYAGLRQYHI